MKTLAFFCCLFVCFNLSGQSYYVSPNGTDSPSAGTITNPWQSFQYAISQVSAGATVYFRGGVYPSSYVVINKSGGFGNYITFKNYPNETPIIDGGNSTQTLLRITDQAYIIIDGLHFRNVLGDSSRGVFVEGSSHHIEILNCKIYNINVTNASPYLPNNCNFNVSPLKFCGNINTQAMTDILVKGNEIFSCRTGCSEGVAISGNVNGFVIENNIVHDITNIGIVAAGHYSSCGTGQAQNGKIIRNSVYRCRFPNTAFNSTASGIYIDGGKNITAEYNTVYDCQVGMQIGCENINKTASNDTIRNNIVYNNDRWGIGIGSGASYPSQAGKSRNSAVLNNTLFKNASKNLEYGFFDRYSEIRVAYTDYSKIQNNIVYANSEGRLLTIKYDTLLGNQIDYNVFFAEDGQVTTNVNWNWTNYTFLDYKSVASQDLNSIFSNPQFNGINILSPELHLQSNSPAINFSNPALQNRVGLVDYDGNTRRINNADAGAYEFQCPTTYNVEGSLTNTAVKFETSNTIQATNSVLTGVKATYDARKSILLLPSFKVESGAVFKAQIDGCGNN